MESNVNSANTPEQNDKSNLYIEYMSAIILQLPDADVYTLLTGSTDTQASFYFQNAQGQVNDSLYNNFINNRVFGLQKPYGVPLAGLENDAFTNSYLSVYTKLSYQLSTSDQKTQDHINLEVGSTISGLTPIWNKWRVEYAELDVIALNEWFTNIALIEMTEVLNSKWIAPAYLPIIAKDPAYPYENLNKFDAIYALIPKSAPAQMISLMKQVFALSEAGGAITSRQANAVHTILGIISNVQKPLMGEDGNGAVELASSHQLIPGIRFNPPNPEEIIKQLSVSPVVSYSSSASSVTKISNDILSVKIGGNPPKNRPMLEYFALITDKGEKSSIFQESYAGSSYTVHATINNPVINPIPSNHPLEWNPQTNMGWFDAAPVKQAIQNGYPPSPETTGYVFNSQSNFNFAKGGDFGYIKSFVFSHFLQVIIELNDCNAQGVKSYFLKHTTAALEFAGMNFNTSRNAELDISFHHESETSIVVVLQLTRRTYIPPAPNDIGQSLCQLVAVEIVYPFA